MKALLDLPDQRQRSCEAVDVIAREYLSEVERNLADLVALRRTLTASLRQCRHGTLTECHVIEAPASAPSATH